jgi:hypothetical protein
MGERVPEAAIDLVISMATVTFRVIPQYENTVLIAPLAKSVFPTPLYANLFTNTQL